MRYQRETLLRCDDDPLFPHTALGIGARGGLWAESSGGKCVFAMPTAKRWDMIDAVMKA